MGPKPNKEEIDSMIQRAVAAAVEAASAQLLEDFTVRIDAKYDASIAECNKLKAENEALKQKIVSLEAAINQTQSKQTDQEAQIKTQLRMIEDLKTKSARSLIWCNKNEQYSRRKNIKIIGYKPNDNQDIRLSVCSLLQDRLALTCQAADIEAAHILPTSRQHPQEKPPNIIVQFSTRECRNEVLQRRRQLKNTGIVILEDLTTHNVKLMNEVKSNENIKNVWSTNGKIIGITKNGKKIRFELNDDVDRRIDAIVTDPKY